MVVWLGGLLYIAAAAGFVKADSPAGRAHHDCVLLKQKIFCYGGAPRRPADLAPNGALLNNFFYSLDLSEDKSVSDLQNSWVPIGGGVGPNYYFAMAALPGLNSFVIDGGRGSGAGAQPAQIVTAIFNVTEGQGSWSQVTSPRDRVESHTAVAANNDMIYIAGGRISALYSGNVSGTDFPDQMTTFNILSPEPWGSTPAKLQRLSSQMRMHHKSALAADGQTIYYIGGIYAAQEKQPNSGQYLHAYVNMKEILVFDTSVGTWGNLMATGLTPTSRMDHTVTMLNGTGKIIVYGGTSIDSATPLDDYFYILDTDTWSYSNLSLSSSTDAQGAGPRFGHSAVLVGNSSLFIIFGSNGEATSEVHVLDTEKWSWKSSVSAVTLPQDGNNNGADTEDEAKDKDDGSSGSNAGTIAGAVVGAVVGVAIIGSIVLFFLRQRRGNRKHNSDQASETMITGDGKIHTPHDENMSVQTEPHNTLPYTHLKPDGHSEEQAHQRLIMTPVKPDGV